MFPLLVISSRKLWNLQKAPSFGGILQMHQFDHFGTALKYDESPRLNLLSATIKVATKRQEFTFTKTSTYMHFTKAYLIK